MSDLITYEVKYSFKFSYWSRSSPPLPFSIVSEHFFELLRNWQHLPRSPLKKSTVTIADKVLLNRDTKKNSRENCIIACLKVNVGMYKEIVFAKNNYCSKKYSWIINEHNGLTTQMNHRKHACVLMQ